VPTRRFDGPGCALSDAMLMLLLAVSARLGHLTGASGSPAAWCYWRSTSQRARFRHRL